MSNRDENDRPVHLEADGITRRPYTDSEWDDYVSLKNIPRIKLDVPASISDRQFFWGLYKKGFITQEQAVKAIKVGETPKFISEILSKIKNYEERIDAEMLIMGAKTIERYNQYTIKFAYSANMDDDGIDDFYRFASTL